MTYLKQTKASVERIHSKMRIDFGVFRRAGLSNWLRISASNEPNLEEAIIFLLKSKEDRENDGL